LLINEIDKMDTDTQETLLDLLEEGIVSETLKSNVREKRYTNISVFATSNDITQLIYPLQTRFFKVKVKAYTKAQFREIGEKVLEEYNLYPTIVDYIINKVVEQPKPNIRTIKQLGKLCNNSAEMVGLLLENSEWVNNNMNQEKIKELIEKSESLMKKFEDNNVFLYGYHLGRKELAEELLKWYTYIIVSILYC